MRVNSSLSCLGLKLCCLSFPFIFMSSMFQLDKDKIWVVSWCLLIVFLTKEQFTLKFDDGFGDKRNPQ